MQTSLNSELTATAQH